MNSGAMLSIALFIQTAITCGTHILYGTIGGICSEKVGNTQLGIEGMMLLGAAFGFWAALLWQNPALAVIAAGVAGSLGALIYAVLTVTLRANQIVTGLVLTIFGTGISGYMTRSLSGHAAPDAIVAAFKPVTVPLLSKIPVIGQGFFVQSPFVLAGFVVALLLWAYFRFTRFGLYARVVGENPAVADAAGLNVTAYKYSHIILGGFLCGVGGSYLSLVFVQRWLDNITAGAGWIAVCLVIVSTWSPAKAIIFSYLFGALKGLGFYFQNTALNVNPQILDMIPYVATILVLVLTTARGKKEYQGPASLGSSFFREER
jgi:simple sugar transport system permease protein